MAVDLSLTRAQVLAFRWRAQNLDAAAATVESLGLLDYGVQDTGEGAAWALRNRGVENPDPDDLFYAWTLRGAPYAYRRTVARDIAIATAPFDDADAAKRVFDASKPLREAGLSIVEGLTRVARAERDIVTKPMVKGALSSVLTDVLAPEHLRYCRPCDAVHCYEQPFRLAALQAGLELEPGTSPPVLRRIPAAAPGVLRHAGRRSRPALRRDPQLPALLRAGDAARRRRVRRCAGDGGETPLARRHRDRRDRRRAADDGRGGASAGRRRRRRGGQRARQHRPAARGLRPVAATARPRHAGRGPGAREGTVAHHRPAGRDRRGRRGRRNLAAPPVRRRAETAGYALAEAGRSRCGPRSRSRRRYSPRTAASRSPASRSRPDIRSAT